jgi:hypothetical protein
MKGAIIMAKLTPQQFSEKLIRRQSGAIDDMRLGVENVKEAPGKRAVAKQAKMKANLMAAIDSGKWAKNLGAVTLEEWKTKMLEVGLGRVQSGIEASRSKIERFAEKFLPFLDGVKAKIDAMPDSTLEERINKATAMMRETAKFKNTR